MNLTKPGDIKADEIRSNIWSQLTKGRKFDRSAESTVRLLVEWHIIADTATKELSEMSGQTSYQDDHGNLKPLPQIGTLHTASTEIRQLEKALSLMEIKHKQTSKSKKASVLHLVQQDRVNKSKQASE